MAIAAGLIYERTWWPPDVGVPFDVKAFLAARPAGEDDGYPLYAEAVRLMDPSSPRVGPAGYSPLVLELNKLNEHQEKGVWSRASPALRSHLARNAPALAAWRRGTERRGAAFPAQEGRRLIGDVEALADLLVLCDLALFEASRLEDSGDAADAADAWTWHRAALRFGRHLANMHGKQCRGEGASIHFSACARVVEWADRPGVTPELLRLALKDCDDVARMTPHYSDTLKAEYLELMASLDDPDEFAQVDWINLPPPWYARAPLPKGWAAWLCARDMRAQVEPARRVARLFYANWIAHFDEPPGARGRPVTRDLPRLYAPEPVATRGGRAFDFASIRRYYASTPLARELIFVSGEEFYLLEKFLNHENEYHADMILSIAARLYELERGDPPQDLSDLIGPYIKRLPAGIDRKVMESAFKDRQLPPSPPFDALAPEPGRPE